MELAFDIFELPKKYTFNNQESLLDGVYIDDNSLFTYFCISRGLFEIETDYQTGFLFLSPFEWLSVDYISFLLSVSKSYKLQISKIGTYAGAVEDDYEVTSTPKKYKGAYKWILELKEKEPNREEVLLFEKFVTQTASASDLERALIYADRTAPSYKGAENTEPYLSKHLFRTILDYTHFAINLTPAQKNNLQDDINTYLDLFIGEKLVRNSKSKRIGNTSASQSQNIRTYKKQSQMFREYLQQMQDNYGNTLTIENIFEDKFPNLKYPDEESMRKRYEERSFFFVHMLLAFEKQGLLKIRLIASNWTAYEDRTLCYKAQIELLPAFQNEDIPKKLSFNEVKARFYVQGNEIKLKKFGDEYNTLRVIFSNPQDIGKEWFFDEIAEEDGREHTEGKKFYNAIYQLKLKLSKLGINDFFTTNRESVIINKKYLS